MPLFESGAAAMRLPGGARTRMQANGRHRLGQRPDEIVIDRRAALPRLQLPQNFDQHPVPCGRKSESICSQSTPAAACEQHTYGCALPPQPPRSQTAFSAVFSVRRGGRRENQCQGRAGRRKRSRRWTRPPRSRAPPRSCRRTPLCRGPQGLGVMVHSTDLHELANAEVGRCVWVWAAPAHRDAPPPIQRS